MANGILIYARKSNVRNLRKSLLIVCEGERTEPTYFESFPLNKQVREIIGAGANTLSVVKEAVRARDNGNFDEVWCVFDRDSFPESRVRDAFNLATQEKIKIAFSNESFELWYLLHYQFLDTAIGRADYCRKLAGIIGSYKKNDISMYQRLLPLQSTAIKNANKLKANINNQSLSKSCPVTTVHKLVLRLNQLIAKQ